MTEHDDALDHIPPRKIDRMETVNLPPRKAFYVDETMATPNGYIPSIIEEGIPGHCPMIGNGEHARPWYWGTDIAVAKEICADANEKLGLTPADVVEIVSSSIAASIRTDAHQQDLADRYERLKKGRA